MSDFLITGTLVGLIFSLLHSVYMYQLVASGGNSTAQGSTISALNFSLWTILLWLLMGAYLVGFWIIAVVFYIIFKAFR